MIDKESDIRPIAYGGMLLEGFVSIAALVAACSLEPGDYFKINVRQEKYAAAVAAAKTKYGLDLTASHFQELERGAGKEHLAGKVGGAVTLAVGMAEVFGNLPGMKRLSAYWYHFVIMFEALFILTLLETGTRACRFIVQEAVEHFGGACADRRLAHWFWNVAASVAVCFLWGYLLCTGSIENLWRMMGIANQLLAIIALAIGTSYLLAHAKKAVYALTTAVPLAFLLVTVFTAGIESIRSWWGDLGRAGTSSADAFNIRLNCALAGFMLLLSAVIVAEAARRWYIMRGAGPPGRGNFSQPANAIVNWKKQLFARKDLELLLAEAAGEHRLHRVLGPVALTSLGVGCIIGAGIFVMTGRAAAFDAGPAVTISFAIAGLGCACRLVLR